MNIKANKDPYLTIFTFVLLDTLEESPQVKPFSTFYVKMISIPNTSIQNNTAPIFAKPIPAAVFLDNCSNDHIKWWHYKLPDVIDNEGDAVERLKF